MSVSLKRYVFHKIDLKRLTQRRKRYNASPQIDGHGWNEFIGRNLHECIYTPLDYTAFIIGWTSLVFWFCCQIPQFYTVRIIFFRLFLNEEINAIRTAELQKQECSSFEYRIPCRMVCW